MLLRLALVALIAATFGCPIAALAPAASEEAVARQDAPQVRVTTPATVMWSPIVRPAR
jgi:hypothetical protein